MINECRIDMINSRRTNRRGLYWTCILPIKRKMAIRYAQHLGSGESPLGSSESGKVQRKEKGPPEMAGTQRREPERKGVDERL